MFNALAMKWFQLCFVASVSSYAGIWVTLARARAVGVDNGGMSATPTNARSPRF